MNNNMFTDLMLFMHYNFNMLLVVYVGILFSVYSLYRLYDKKPYLAIFSLFYGIDKIKRGMMFCNLYRLLIPKGATPPDIIDMLMETETGFVHDMYATLRNDMLEGTSLVKAMPLEHWPSSMVSLLPNLERIGHEKKTLVEILTTFNQSLSLDLESRYQKVGSNLVLAGMSSLVLATLILAIGYMIPMYGNMSSMRG